MKRLVAGLVCLMAVSCGSQAPDPQSPSVDAPRASAGEPIAVTFERGGEKHAFTCATLSANIADDSSAVRAGDDENAFLACADAKTGLAVNVTVPLRVGKHTPTPKEDDGRIGALTYKLPRTAGDAPEDMVTTSGVSLPTAHVAGGTIEVQAWDAASGRLQGTATMRWEKDNTGKPGALAIAFDLKSLGK